MKALYLKFIYKYAPRVWIFTLEAFQLLQHKTWVRLNALLTHSNCYINIHNPLYYLLLKAKKNWCFLLFGWMWCFISAWSGRRCNLQFCGWLAPFLPAAQLTHFDFPQNFIADLLNWPRGVSQLALRAFNEQTFRKKKPTAQQIEFPWFSLLRPPQFSTWLKWLQCALIDRESAKSFCCWNLSAAELKPQ